MSLPKVEQCDGKKDQTLPNFKKLRELIEQAHLIRDRDQPKSGDKKTFIGIIDPTGTTVQIQRSEEQIDIYFNDFDPKRFSPDSSATSWFEAADLLADSQDGSRRILKLSCRLDGRPYAAILDQSGEIASADYSIFHQSKHLQPKELEKLLILQTLSLFDQLLDINARKPFKSL